MRFKFYKLSLLITFLILILLYFQLGSAVGTETNHILVDTFQQEHQVEDPVPDDIYSNMRSTHLYQAPVITNHTI